MEVLNKVDLLANTITYWYSFSHASVTIGTAPSTKALASELKLNGKSGLGKARTSDDVKWRFKLVPVGAP